MAQQTINLGASANDGTGDPLRDALDKVNDNFASLFTQVPAEIVDNNYFILGLGTSASTVSGLAANTLFLTYDTLESDVTIDEIGLGVGASVASGLLRVGLWACDAVTGLPTGAPLVDSGDLDASSSGNKLAVVSPVLIPAGPKWIGVVNNNTSARQVGPTSLHLPAKRIGLASSPLTSTSVSSGFQVAHTFGALPDLTSASLTASSAQRGAVAILRAAS